MENISPVRNGKVDMLEDILVLFRQQDLEVVATQKHKLFKLFLGSF
jgi:hypothetical protein